jgi:hypothetical protein
MRFVKGAFAGACICFVTLSATAAAAGSGIGSVFNLGKTNSVNRSTVLSGSTRGPQLRVVNNNTTTRAGVAGIGIQTRTGIPPLAVNSKSRVNNLNADLLDGESAGSFVAGGGRIASSRRTTAISDASLEVLNVPGFGALDATCGATGFGFVLRNGTNPKTAVDVWIVSDGSARFSEQGANDDATVFAIADTGDDVFDLQLGTTGHTASVTAAGHWTPDGCAFAAQAVSQ